MRLRGRVSPMEVVPLADLAKSGLVTGVDVSRPRTPQTSLNIVQDVEAPGSPKTDSGSSQKALEFNAGSAETAATNSLLEVLEDGSWDSHARF